MKDTQEYMRIGRREHFTALCLIHCADIIIMIYRVINGVYERENINMGGMRAL